MFKAKLIENQNYYKLRSRQLLLMFVPFIPIGIIINLQILPTSLTILMIGLYFGAFFLMVKNQKMINAVLGNKSIEIDLDEIRIISKIKSHNETFNLKTIEKIILKDKYSMPQENLKVVTQDISGMTNKNYVILKQKKQNRQFEFEVDSYYMLNQLNKLIDSWKIKGYNIEWVSEN